MVTDHREWKCTPQLSAATISECYYSKLENVHVVSA